MKLRPGMGHHFTRKKLVVKLPQATLVEKSPPGKRKGCISMVVRATSVGVKILKAPSIELRRGELVT